MNLNSIPIDPIFEKSIREFFSVLAEAHAFDLKALTTAEVQRLLNFVQIAEISRYPEFSAWPEKVFLTARQICEQKVYALIDQQPK